MGYETIKVGVISATPGNDSSVYNLFNSTVTFANGLRTHDIGRIEVSLVNNQSGTIRFYKSSNKGTNFDQVGGDIAVVASTATDINGPYDFLVDPYDDVKIDWVNGGTAQTTWRPEVVLVRGARPAAI